MKILFAEIYEEWQKEFVLAALPEDEVEFFDAPLNEESDLSKHIGTDILSIFVDSTVTQNVLNELVNVRYVAARSTGFDHIDFSQDQKNEVLVSNVPVYGDNTVAEYAFGLILSLSRKIPGAVYQTRTFDFDYSNLVGIDLEGKSLGILGCGKIGLNVVRMANAFGMKPMVYDIVCDLELAHEHKFEYVELDTLLSTSDIITLHVPLNPKTKHIINDGAFEMMKEGVFLVNTARGGLIETESLIANLKSGKVAAAALDVLEEEHLMKLAEDSVKDEKSYRLNTELLGMENVLITPHNAFNTHEAVQRILQTTIDNINAFKSGHPINLVK